MNRIKNNSVDEFVENKSRFITYLQRVENEADVANFIKEIKKTHPKATHHCQASLINENLQSSNDDGEPSGTAGLPMLEILRKRNMEKIAAVVVRYYGGIKLGAGGLIRAYSKGVNEALNKADIYQVKEINKFKVVTSYPYADQIEHLLNSETILDKDYGIDVSFTYLSNDKSLENKIREITSGQAIIEFVERKEVEILKKEDSDD